MQNAETTSLDLAKAMEAQALSMMQEVKKDKEREKHFRRRVVDTLRKVQKLVEAAESIAPNFKTSISLPNEYRKTLRGNTGYGAAAKLARKLVKEVGGGTFLEVYAYGIETGQVDPRQRETLRQAVYGLARRRALRTTTQGGKTSFDISNNKAALSGAALSYPSPGSVAGGS